MKPWKMIVLGRHACAMLASITLLLAGARETAGQEPKLPQPNVVYGELLGNTLLGVNYERLLSTHASLRIGLGVAPLNEGAVPLALVMPNLLLGSSRHQLEAGVGVLFASISDDQSLVMPTASLAYRRRADRSFIRVGVGIDVFDDRLWVTPGFGVGLSF